MSTVAGFAHVNHYREMSYLQLYRLRSNINQVVKLDIIDVANQKQVLDWEDVAYRLNNSVKTSRPFFRFIGDLLTLQFIKKWTLQIILPGLIKDIDAVVAKVYAARGKPVPKMTIHGALRDPMAYSENPLDIIIKANAYFQSHKASLCVANPLGVVSVEGDDKKLENEVNEYFQEKIKLLTEGHATAIPLWYHATKSSDALVSIINSGNLVQHNAPKGMGVYFSTEDEHYSGYGDHTFAVDFSVIHSLPTKYFHIISSGKSTVWVGVQQNVPITWNSVAHIAVNNQAGKKEMLDKLNDEQGLTDANIGIVSCPVITRLASDIIRDVIQKTHAYKLPPLWKKHSTNWFSPYNLPFHLKAFGT